MVFVPIPSINSAGAAARRSVFVGALLALLSTPLDAQGVRGIVRDTEGAPLPDATIRINGATMTVSSADGRFVVPRAEGAALLLTVERLGFRSWSARVDVPGDGWIELFPVLTPTAVELSPMVVTGTLSETRVADSPVKVDVVSSSLLRRHAASSLMDGVGRINGLYPQVDCGVCYTNNIRINGMEGPYTAILIDGTPIVGALASVYGLNGIHPSIVERLEILKGPQSTLHGAEAMGGVVNIVTKDPRFAPELAVEASRTSFGENNASVSWAPGSGRSGILLSGSVTHDDRFIDDNGDGFSDLSLDTRVSLFARAALRREGRRVGHLAAKAYHEDRFGGVEAWTPAHRGSGEVYGESIRTERVEFTGSLGGPWSDTRLELSASLHRQDSFYGETRFAADQAIVFGRVLWDPPRGASRHDILVGAALTADRYDDDTPATPQADLRWIPGAFVEDHFHVSEAVTLLGGLRADHHAHHGLILSPRASVMWRPTADATIRLNAGTGFRVVHLFTEDHAALTGARDVVVEGDLAPERSASVAFNYNQIIEFGRFPMMIDVDAFHTRFTNRIVPDYDVDPNLIVYRNLDGRRSVGRGVALSVNQNFDVVAPLSYTLGLTIQDVFLDGGGEPAEAEFFAADYRGVWSLRWGFLAGLTADYAGTVTGPMRLPEFEGEFARPTRSETFTTHDLEIAWSWSPGRSLAVGVQNLTGFTQPSPLVDAANPFGPAFDTSWVYGPVAGRRFSVSLGYTVGR